MQMLINEIRKVIENVGAGGTITKEVIDSLCIKKVDNVIFDLTDSLGRKDIKKALEVLDNLIYNKEPAQKILITLYSHFKKLYLTKKAIILGKDIQQALELKSSFIASKYKSQAAAFEERTIRNLLNEFIFLDENSKKGNIDLTLGMQSVLCCFCA